MLHHHPTLPFAFLLVLLWAVLPACANDIRADTDTEDNGTEEPTETTVDSTIALELMAEGFTNPLSMEQGPDGRFYIVDQIGQIRVTDEQGQLQSEPFLDISDRMVDLTDEHDERGLLGLALHPEFAENGRFYIHYSAPLRAGAPNDWSHTKHLSEFQLDPNTPPRADPTSERILMRIDEPQTNHNGGTLVFGPDNYLYLGLGDGGGANDTGTGHSSDWYERNDGGNGQNRSNLLGSIIRIDVDGGDPYGIPADNPFVGGERAGELFAVGLRNPYRFSFHNGLILVGDVGQKLWEEINVVESGGNYGWNVREGYTCFNAAEATQPLDDCPRETPEGEPLVEPVLVFPHKAEADYVPYGLAVIGGLVYEGGELNGMGGSYLFGTWTQQHDNPSGVVYAAARSGDIWREVRQIRIDNSPEGHLGRYLSAFATDNNGELYLLTTENEAPVGNTGKIFRVRDRADYDYTTSANFRVGGHSESDGHSEHSH